MLTVALGALVATDAGGSAVLAWAGTAAACLLVALGPVARSAGPAQLGAALLGALLLLRHDNRLLLAPIYGAGLVLVAELAWRPSELRRVAALAEGVVPARAGALLATAALGACAAACAALAVTAAPGRSLVLTVVAALVAIAAFAAIVGYLRRLYRASADVREGGQAAG